MTFVPYLGSGYPHNQPLSWRTTSVRVGGVELIGAALPEHHHTDFRYEYRLGVVTEAYDVRSDGLERPSSARSASASARRRTGGSPCPSGSIR